jgi:hypothetical protein
MSFVDRPVYGASGLATRKPIFSDPSSTVSQDRAAARSSEGLSAHEPPRVARAEQSPGSAGARFDGAAAGAALQQSSVHCRTLPSIL